MKYIRNIKQEYKLRVNHIKTVEFMNSGHDLRESEYDKYIKTIKDFLL